MSYSINYLPQFGDEWLCLTLRSHRMPWSCSTDKRNLFQAPLANPDYLIQVQRPKVSVLKSWYIPHHFTCHTQKEGPELLMKIKDQNLLCTTSKNGCGFWLPNSTVPPVQSGDSLMWSKVMGSFIPRWWLTGVPIIVLILPLSSLMSSQIPPHKSKNQKAFYIIYFYFPWSIDQGFLQLVIQEFSTQKFIKSILYQYPSFRYFYFWLIAHSLF